MDAHAGLQGHAEGRETYARGKVRQKNKTHGQKPPSDQRNLGERPNQESPESKKGWAGSGDLCVGVAQSKAGKEVCWAVGHLERRGAPWPPPCPGKDVLGFQGQASAHRFTEGHCICRLVRTRVPLGAVAGLTQHTWDGTLSHHSWETCALVRSAG